MMSDDVTSTGYLISSWDAPNPWARISEIAGKVGVQPMTPGAATICATGADGKQYDIWEVIAAVLDKLDSADS